MKTILSLLKFHLEQGNERNVLKMRYSEIGVKWRFGIQANDTQGNSVKAWTEH